MKDFTKADYKEFMHETLTNALSATRTVYGEDVDDLPTCSIMGANIEDLLEECLSLIDTERVLDVLENE